jgi:ubiquitin-protein ligase
MLGEKEWMPNKKVGEVLDIIMSMLASPDISSAINLEAAKDFKEGTFEKKVREMVEKQTELK